MDSPAAIRPRVRWPELDLHERRIVCLIGAAGFFNQYDLGLVSLFLRHIQADLAISEASVGWMGSAIRMGALPAFGFMLLADRLGRRRLLLWTIAGYTLCTVATAFAPSAAAFTAAQLVGRMFMEAEVTLGIVVVVEELRPGNRAWGVGVISLLAFLGRALGMALFAFVDDLPFGWRFAYLVGLFPLGLLVYLRRALPETRRFERAAQGTRTSVASLVRPALALLRAYPGRFAAVGCVGFF